VLPYNITSAGFCFNFNLRFFALKIERVVQYHDATPLLVLYIDVITMGRGSWVNCVMGHSHGSWVTKDDPFPSLVWNRLPADTCWFTCFASFKPTTLQYWFYTVFTLYVTVMTRFLFFGVLCFFVVSLVIVNITSWHVHAVMLPCSFSYWIFDLIMLRCLHRAWELMMTMILKWKWSCENDREREQLSNNN